MAAETVDIPIIIGGKEIRTGTTEKVVMPHKHGHVLGNFHKATDEHVRQAAEAAVEARKEWSSWSFDDRAAVFLRAAELLTTTWRSTIVAATMLGQSKTAFQAEIDAASELVDFWRFNVAFAQELLSEQPDSSHSVWNQMEYRPLEGFVYAVSPFNFTAIGGNLAGAPALMGNAVLWKPASTSMLSSYYVMRLLEAAGLPPGVINFLPGDAVVDLEHGPRSSRSRRHSLHRQHRRVQQHVADGRPEPRQVSRLSAAGRRNRRQGLHRRARLGRSAGGRGRRGARRVRVPGPEVLGRQPHVCAEVDAGTTSAIAWSR